MEDRGRLNLKIVALVLSLAVIAWAVYFASLDKKTDIKKADTPIISEAPRGEAVLGLPDNLVFNGKVEITQSHTTSYAESSRVHKSVAFTSSKSPDENFAYYEKWARDNDWRVTNSGKSQYVQFLYLEKIGEEMNITINKSSVSIGYIKK